jgi:hypothetical protein
MNYDKAMAVPEIREKFVELEAERESASQDYADLLKDYRALRVALTIIASCGATMTVGEMREHALAALEVE